ncbi:MAG: 30S ribosomal protein S15 [Desulfobacterota bacterium]|nr:30S ribosomal protein S15 [Thermodesulfobacteriota bacterium]
MVLQSAQKQQIIAKFQTHEKDTGSTKVQIALLTERINYLTEHFKMHKKDFHSRRGLLKIVNKRRKLLEYLKQRDYPTYKELIQQLNIRK